MSFNNFMLPRKSEPNPDISAFYAQQNANNTIANTNLPAYTPQAKNENIIKKDAYEQAKTLAGGAARRATNIDARSDPNSVYFDPNFNDPRGNSTETPAAEAVATETPTNDSKVSVNWEDIIAAFEDAEGYSEWLAKNGIDTEAARAEAYKNRAAEYDRNRSTYGRNAENLAQLGLSNSGYSDYLDGVGYAAYISGLSEADNQKALQDAEYARQYSQYLSQKQSEAKQKALTLYSAVTSGDLTEEQAAQYAKFLGLSDEDAQNIGKHAASVTKTKTDSTTEAETTQMGTAVYEYVMQNGGSTEAALKYLYPNATPEQIEYVIGYVKSTKNLTLTGHVNEEVGKLSQNVNIGNADISGYDTLYNTLLKSTTDPEALETNRAVISTSLKNDLARLYDEGGGDLSTSYLSSYIAAKYGKDENDYKEKKWNKMTDEEKAASISGIGAYESLTDEEKGKFLNDVLDELYKDGNGVLTEDDYNELKYKAFEKDIINTAKTMQDIVELDVKVGIGYYGTEKVQSQLEETLINYLSDGFSITSPPSETASLLDTYLNVSTATEKDIKMTFSVDWDRSSVSDEIVKENVGKVFTVGDVVYYACDYKPDPDNPNPSQPILYRVSGFSNLKTKDNYHLQSAIKIIAKLINGEK